MLRAGGSCSTSSCGGYGSGCYCDQICFSYNDCCYNVVESCPGKKIQS